MTNSFFYATLKNMIGFGLKKELKVKRERKNQNSANANLDVKKVLESADQKLIVMVRN